MVLFDYRAAETEIFCVFQHLLTISNVQITDKLIRKVVKLYWG